MMQKLQEDSARTHTSSTPTVAATSSAVGPLPKSARQMAESLLDGTGSNGSFLDGIIRSSLESGVPGNEDKSPKDEKNLAPENMSNKALLGKAMSSQTVHGMDQIASRDISARVLCSFLSGFFCWCCRPIMPKQSPHPAAQAEQRAGVEQFRRGEQLQKVGESAELQQGREPPLGERRRWRGREDGRVTCCTERGRSHDRTVQRFERVVARTER